jgi:hypothetical protein
MRITEKMWDYEGTVKYLGIDGMIFKVPWRYNRVMGLEVLRKERAKSLQMIMTSEQR